VSFIDVYSLFNSSSRRAVMPDDKRFADAPVSIWARHDAGQWRALARSASALCGFTQMLEAA
jgi:hypothetical protein